MKIFAVHPGAGKVTKYTKYWVSKFVDQVQEGNDVIDVKDESLSAQHILTAINNEQPDFIYTAGHGIPELTTISTNNGFEDLFWIPTDYSGHEHDDSNISILKNKGSYILSCQCGEKLVPAISEVGGESAGYEEDFVFVIDPSRYSVEDDPYAESFGVAANQFPISYVSGRGLQNSINDAWEVYTAESDEWKKWLDENPDAPSHQKVRVRLCTNYMLSDRDILVGSQMKPRLAGVGMLGLVLGLIFAIIYGASKKEE